MYENLEEEFNQQKLEFSESNRIRKQLGTVCFTFLQKIRDGI